MAARNSEMKKGSYLAFFLTRLMYPVAAAIALIVIGIVLISDQASIKVGFACLIGAAAFIVVTARRLVKRT